MSHVDFVQGLWEKFSKFLKINPIKNLFKVFEQKRFEQITIPSTWLDFPTQPRRKTN
jgi:hypothetical protein